MHERLFAPITADPGVRFLTFEEIADASPGATRAGHPIRRDRISAPC